MPNLKTTQLTAACDIFNKARAAGNYSALAQYLAPHVVMHRVDDPIPVVGAPGDIINYLNAKQATTNKFPILDYGAGFSDPDAGSPNDITGYAFYFDRTDTSVVPIPVRYNFHFTNDNPPLIEDAVAFRIK